MLLGFEFPGIHLFSLLDSEAENEEHIPPNDARPEYF
jgi:hypothetical protein